MTEQENTPETSEKHTPQEQKPKNKKTKTEAVRPMTVRVTVEQHIKLKQRAAEQQVTMSEIIGELIDSL